MKLNELYSYVFGDLASMGKEEKTQAAFKFLDKSPKLYQKFLRVLTALDMPSSNKLYTLLANGEKPVLSDEEKTTIKNQYSDEEIKKKFTAKNNDLHYFSEEETKTENEFNNFFKACKLMGDFVEQNNDEEDTLAQDIAYKMLVVIGAAGGKNNFSWADNYIKEHGKKKKDEQTNKQKDEHISIHDTFVQRIPANEPPLNDLMGWRQFIKKFGYDALSYFQDAHAIESKLEYKAPKTKEEAEKAASQIRFKRANEYPELARLCKQYHVSEEIFNKCLEIEKNRKKSDLLPNIEINGSNLGQEGYHLVKLPVDDPRAYILGEITNCCQSVGNHGEQCVIDGITCEKNGFYVLLKQKKGKGKIQPIQEGKINYDAFDIVGQGYAWLSRHGNMTFDSWENLRPESDDKVIVPMLNEFGKRATEQNDILRVTIGCGGKTPEEFENQGRVPYPELSEGYQYGDSYNQWLISFNQQKFDKKKEELINKYDLIQNPVWQTKQNFEQFIGWLSSYHQLTDLNKFFLDQTMNDLWKEAGLDISNIKKPLLAYKSEQKLLYPEELENAFCKPYVAWLDGANLLDKHKLLTIENLTLLIRSCQDYNYFVNALFVISKHIEINNENYQLLAKKAVHSRRIAQAITNLHIATPELVNNENFKLLTDIRLLENGYAYEITIIMHNLQQINPTLASQKNFKLLTENAYTESIRHGIECLSKNNPTLVNEENFQLLMTKPKHAYEIAQALITLHQTNTALLNKENRQQLVASGTWASTMGNILALLYKADPALVNDENRRLLLLNASQFLKAIEWMFDALYKINPELINNDNFKLFINSEFTYLGDDTDSMIKIFDLLIQIKKDKKLFLDEISNIQFSNESIKLFIKQIVLSAVLINVQEKELLQAAYQHPFFNYQRDKTFTFSSVSGIVSTSMMKFFSKEFTPHYYETPSQKQIKEKIQSLENQPLTQNTKK